MRRTGLLCLFSLVAILGCDAADSPGLATATQAVSGPTGVAATSTAVGQVDINWSAETPAFKYYVYQSVSGGAFNFLASVLDPNDPFGRPPPTTYTATGLTPGVQYCYEIQAAFPDGTTSDMSSVACVQTSGAPTGCQIAVSRLSGLAVRLGITSTCNGDGWSLDYRMFSSAGGLAVANVRDHACGSATFVEMLVTGQLPLLDLTASGWIFTPSTRVDCTVTVQ